jgi:hypothetical protein
MGDAVLRREFQHPVVVRPTPRTQSAEPWEQVEEEDEPIDLSFLLNLLDGTLEASGRILAISSNHPERIDRALIRPGRVDEIVEFKKCNNDILKQMVESFYDQPFDTIPDMPYKWSPAEVNQILFRNFKNPAQAVRELETLQPHELSGIREDHA